MVTDRQTDKPTTVITPPAHAQRVNNPIQHTPFIIIVSISMIFLFTSIVCNYYYSSTTIVLNGPIRSFKKRLINHLSTYKFKIQGCMTHGRSWLYTSVMVAMVIYQTSHPSGPRYDKSHSYLHLHIFKLTTDCELLTCTKSVRAAILSLRVPEESTVFSHLTSLAPFLF